MNQYAAQARKHWEEFLPRRYATLSDPNSFFSTLGEQAAEQIEDLTRQLAGPDQPGEGHLAKMGRLTNARQRAEEIVLPQLILIDPANDQPENPDETASTPIRDEWAPMTEDPTHPYWQTVAEQENALTEDPPNR